MDKVENEQIELKEPIFITMPELTAVYPFPVPDMFLYCFVCHQPAVGILGGDFGEGYRDLDWTEQVVGDFMDWVRICTGSEIALGVCDCHQGQKVN